MDRIDALEEKSDRIAELAWDYLVEVDALISALPCHNDTKTALRTMAAQVITVNQEIEDELRHYLKNYKEWKPAPREKKAWEWWPWEWHRKLR